MSFPNPAACGHPASAGQRRPAGPPTVPASALRGPLPRRVRVRAEPGVLVSLGRGPGAPAQGPGPPTACEGGPRPTASSVGSLADPPPTGGQGLKDQGHRQISDGWAGAERGRGAGSGPGRALPRALPAPLRDGKLRGARGRVQSRHCVWAGDPRNKCSGSWNKLVASAPPAWGAWTRQPSPYVLRTFLRRPNLAEDRPRAARGWRRDPAPHSPAGTPPPTLRPGTRAGQRRREAARALVSPYICGGRRLRGTRRGGAAFEVPAAAAFILSFFPRRPLCVTKFGKNMDPSQSFHVCSQLPAEKAKGSLPGKETGRKIKEFGELDLKCELKIKIKPGHIPVSKAKPTLSRDRLALTLFLPVLPLLSPFLSCNHPGAHGIK